MKVLEYSEYRKSLLALRNRGGAYQKAAEKAIVMHDDLTDPDRRNKLPITNNGENRINKAVKYDLGNNGCRLVTVQDEGLIFLCFAGTHELADAWINKNRGLTIRVDEKTRPIATFESIDIKEPAQRLDRVMGFTTKPLLSLLEERLTDALLEGIGRRVANRIAEAEAFINDNELEELVDQVPDQDRRSAVFDVLIQLRSDDIEGASRRVRAYLGELETVAETVKAERVLIDSSDFQHINVDSEHYKQLIEHFAKNAEFKDWMLFMHPDQQQFVDANYAGAAKLSGVSGSGKTCVVVRRALALACRYPNEQILIVTLNRSLAALIEDLVDQAADANIRDQIDVLPHFRLCQNLLKEFEPKNIRLYDDITWKGEEHIDEVWREFYRCELNNSGARVLQRLHDSLISRGIDAENYVREEFDWIRSATPLAGRDSYLGIVRTGRTYPLDESFRRELLAGLSEWEKKMRFVGVTDYLGIANALCKHIDRIAPRYRCVLIDESQDFGTVDLQIIRKLVSEDENDVFFCGDAAQQVSSKHQNLSDSGIPVPGARSHKLTLNYRNSREILELAHGMLVDNLTEQMVDAKDFDVLDPRYANFSGPAPLLLLADDLRQALHAAIAHARSEAESNPVYKVCVAICGYTEHELERFAKILGLPVLDGAAGLDQGQIFLSDLENTKGFEFQVMIIVNCSSGVIPNPRAPTEENFRDLSRLYVAMTRARQQLVVSYTGEPSEFLKNQRAKFSEERWDEYLGAFDVPADFQVPAHLEQMRSQNESVSALDLSGEQYLYTDHALGCSPMLIDKLRSAVSGRSVIRNGAPAEWTTIRSALNDTRNIVRSRQIFGPEGYRVLRERFDELA